MHTPRQRRGNRRTGPASQFTAARLTACRRAPGLSRLSTEWLAFAFRQCKLDLSTTALRSAGADDEPAADMFFKRQLPVKLVWKHLILATRQQVVHAGATYLLARFTGRFCSCTMCPSFTYDKIARCPDRSNYIAFKVFTIHGYIHSCAGVSTPAGQHVTWLRGGVIKLQAHTQLTHAEAICPD